MTSRGSLGGMEPRALAGALRRREHVLDRVFDEVYPLWARSTSRVHWTPVAVAQRVAAELTRPGARGPILDVGAGVGKFCIVASATTGRPVHGVEHRPHLVRVARRTALELGVDADVFGGTFEGLQAADYSGVYLFNPFGENVCARRDRLDETVELSERRYHADLRAMTTFLRALHPSARVAIYCGWGGVMPDGFVRVSDSDEGGRLQIWERSL